MSVTDTKRRGRAPGAILVVCVVLASAGCRPDYAKLEACTPAELVEIMRGGWRVNRGAAGAELSLLAMRKPEIVRLVSDKIHELLDSPYPETRRWATCVLLEIDRYRQDATSSAQVMLSDKGKDDIATENRSKVLYHLVKNPICQDPVTRTFILTVTVRGHGDKITVEECQALLIACLSALFQGGEPNNLDTVAASSKYP